MRAVVAFDVTHAAGEQTGVGRAVREMYDAVSALAPPALIPFAWGRHVRERASEYPSGTRFVAWPARALLQSWGRLGVPRIDRTVRPANVVHASAFVAPASALPTLVTIYDATFVRPEADEVQRLWRRPLERALVRGAHVHVGTRSVATELDVLYGAALERKRIHIIPFGIPRLKAAEPLPPAIAGRLGGAPYVVSISTSVARKNMPRLVRAFGAVAGSLPDLRLVLAGGDGPDRGAVDDAIASLADPSRVIVTGFVPDGVRRTLIEGARVLAYPSLYEGFGFPILEAMSLGTPVVTSGMGSMYDVAGDAADFVEPTDIDSIASALARVTSDETHRDALIARGRAHATGFSWEQTATKLASVYDVLANTSS